MVQYKEQEQLSHMMDMHSDKTLLYLCCKCEMRFDFPFDIASHIRNTHKENQKQHCSVTLVEFNAKTNEHIECDPSPKVHTPKTTPQKAKGRSPSRDSHSGHGKEGATSRVRNTSEVVDLDDSDDDLEVVSFKPGNKDMAQQQQQQRQTPTKSQRLARNKSIGLTITPQKSTMRFNTNFSDQVHRVSNQEHSPPLQSAPATPTAGNKNGTAATVVIDDDESDANKSKQLSGQPEPGQTEDAAVAPPVHPATAVSALPAVNAATFTAASGSSPLPQGQCVRTNNHGDAPGVGTPTSPGHMSHSSSSSSSASLEGIERLIASTGSGPAMTDTTTLCSSANPPRSSSPGSHDSSVLMHRDTIESLCAVQDTPYDCQQGLEGPDNDLPVLTSYRRRGLLDSPTDELGIKTAPSASVDDTGASVTTHKDKLYQGAMVPTTPDFPSDTHDSYASAFQNFIQTADTESVAGSQEEEPHNGSL